MTLRLDTEAERETRFEAVFAEVYEPVQRYVRRRCSADDVDDLVADVMLVLWRRLSDVPGDAALPWAYGIARNCLANQRRSVARVTSLVRRLKNEPAYEPVLATNDPALEAAIAAFTPADRELIRLWAWEQLPPREIAIALGITANAASIRLHRIKARLVQSLGKNGPLGGHVMGERAEEEPA